MVHYGLQVDRIRLKFRRSSNEKGTLRLDRQGNWHFGRSIWTRNSCRKTLRSNSQRRVKLSASVFPWQVINGFDRCSLWTAMMQGWLLA